MRFAIALTAAVLSCALACPAQAADAEAPYGVWRGTLGNQEVVALLSGPDCDSNGSGYYYLRHLTGIHLGQSGDSPLAWTEDSGGQQTGSWTLEKVTANAIEGKWASTDGRHTLPIRLKRVGVGVGASGNKKCIAEVAAFNKARIEKTMGSMTTRDEKLGTLRYRVLSIPGNAYNTFEIPPGEYNVPKLNQGMRGGLESNVVEGFNCEVEAGGRGAEFGVDTIPAKLVAGHILVIESHYNAYCGGAHPDAWSGYGAWDLKTDTAIDPNTWIKYEKSEYGTPQLPDDLIDLISEVSGGMDTDECNDYITESGTGFQISVGSAGLVFHTTLPHVIKACERDIEVPYAKLKPFLTSAGKKAVAALIKNP